MEDQFIAGAIAGIGFIAAFFGICYFAFCMGAISERQAWNKLIENGTIPKPSKKI